MERLEKGQGILWYNELAFWLTLWKRSEEYSFLCECPSQVLQQKLRDLDRAFRDGFDRKQPLKHIPVFRKKGRGDGIRFPQGFKIEGRRIFLPRIGWLGFYKSCNIEGRVKNITVNQRGGRWYASIQVEQIMEAVHHPADSEIGMDAGIESFAALESMRNGWPGSSGNFPGKRKVQITGKSRRKKYRSFITPLPMYVQTFCINSVQRLAKNTQEYLLKD